MKKIFTITFSVLLLIIIGLYLGIVCVLPSIINSKITINKLQSLIHNKTGIDTTITGLNLKISPKLTVALKVDSIDAKNKDVTVADIKKLALNYKLLQKRLTLVSADNIFIDGNYTKQFKKEKKKKKRGKTELDKAVINTPILKETLKLGNSGSLQVAENKLKANKFKVSIGNSHLYLDGVLVNKDKSRDFDIIGEKLPVSEIMPMLLKFQKSKDPSKKFIENFKNFKGTVGVNIKINSEGIWGTCIANNLGANAVWFDIPLFFKEAVFNFEGETITSVAEGILGNEKVIHTLNITDLLNPQKKLVIGEMNTTLTPKFKFVPGLTVLHSANVNLVYKIKNRKPDVYYNIDIPVKSDLIYNSFYFGLRDYKRKIYGNTFKDDNDLYLKKYKYSYFNSGKENIVIYGDGLFIKNIDKNNPDKFIPQFLTIRTNGYAPTSVIGAFGEKVRGGEFKGDLKYDFKNNQVLGTFDIIKARHQAFKIDNAHVIAKDGIFTITSDGLYKGEKYKAELSAKNNIFGETLIYNMKLFLDKLVLETTTNTNKNNKKREPKDFSKTVKENPTTINNWEIAINKIIRDKFVLENVKLVGSLKNNIFNFNMKEMKFADGTINANGFYDFGKNISKMAFEAENIDSNKVAEMTLNLQDQISGIAKAKVNIDAKDMFKYLDANCTFEVKEGYMPKLGDKELAIKDTKYKLSEITNLDLSQKDLMKDDIKGSFYVHNTEINNINLTTWHPLSAMLLEGSYEMEKQYADLQLYWHYSKEAPKGVRIFGIPISLILKVVFRPEYSKELYKSKLSEIPQINADEKNTIYYRIKLKGDINNNKTSLELKEIR